MTKVMVKTIDKDEKFLRQVSLIVEKYDDELKDAIKVLTEYCEENDVMALAAIQVGIPKRIIYLKNTDLTIINKIQKGIATEAERKRNEARILINPIVLSEEGLTDYWEACASCLDNFGHVRRPYKLSIEYFDIFHNKHREDFDGFKATVLAHEIDHLNGILHMDVAYELLQMKQEDRKKFRITHPYNIVSKVGNYTDLMREYQKTKSY